MFLYLQTYDPPHRFVAKNIFGKCGSAIMPLRFEGSQMLLRIKADGNAAAYALVDSVFQCFGSILPHLRKLRIGLQNLVGIVVSRFHKVMYSHKVIIVTRQYNCFLKSSLSKACGHSVFSLCFFFILRKLLKLSSMNLNTSDSR